MANLFRFILVLLFTGSCFSHILAQSAGWIPLATGFSQDLNSIVPAGSGVLAVGADGKYFFYNTQDSQSYSGTMPSVSTFLSAERIRIGANGGRTHVLADQNRIFSFDTLSLTFSEDSLPEMPRSEEIATDLIDLNFTGIDQMRYGFTLDSGRILACKIPYTTTRFEIQLPFAGRINDMISFPSWGVLAVGDSGKIWRTPGLDQNFLPVSQLHHTRKINALIRKGNSVFWAAGDSGSLLLSTNSGTSWSSLSFPVVDNILGGVYAGSSLFLYTSGGLIFRSDNEGQDWEPEYSPAQSAIRDMVVTSDGNFYCAGDNGTFLRRASVTAALSKTSSPWLPDLKISENGQVMINQSDSIVSYLLYDQTGRQIAAGEVPAFGKVQVACHLRGLVFVRYTGSKGEAGFFRYCLNP